MADGLDVVDAQFDLAVVADAGVPVAANPLYARLNITWKGQNADLPDPINVDMDDATVLLNAQEAIKGGLEGITADPTAALKDFVVDRFPATGDLPARIMIRPKTPFGV